MENELEEILTSEKTKDLDKKQDKIIKKAKENITKITKGMIEHNKEIGEKLGKANVKLRKQEAEDNTLTKCTFCKEGNFRISLNRKSRRYFISCNAYPKCKTTFTLPPNSLIKPSKDKEGNIEKCVECGYPMLLALRQGRRPWKFCFNPECASRKKAEEAMQEKLKAKLEKEGKLKEKKD